MVESSGHTSTEQAILDAAEELFFEKGYKLATTTAIAARAGVTHAMLHYYFRTKEQIFLRVLDKNMNEMFAMLQTVMSPDLSVKEVLKEVVDLHYTFLSRHEKLPSLILEIAGTYPELFQRYKPRLRETVSTEILNHRLRFGREMEAGTMNRIDWQQMMFMIISMNLSTYLALPVMRNVFGVEGEQEKAFLEERKKEIIRTLYARLFGKDLPEESALRQ